jgi:hypothetical protein
MRPRALGVACVLSIWLGGTQAFVRRRRCSRCPRLVGIGARTSAYYQLRARAGSAQLAPAPPHRRPGTSTDTRAGMRARTHTQASISRRRPRTGTHTASNWRAKLIGRPILPGRCVCCVRACVRVSARKRPARVRGSPLSASPLNTPCPRVPPVHVPRRLCPSYPPCL